MGKPPETKACHDDADPAFIKRAVVVISIIILVLLVLWFAPAIVFNVGVGVIVVLATRELYVLENSSYKISSFRRLGLLEAGLLALQMNFLPVLPVGVSIPLFLILLLSVTALKTKGPSIEEFRELLFVMFGLLYIGAMFGQIILIRNAQFGRELVFILILTILAREAGAHLGGTLFPLGTLLNANVNSKKSYRGAAVGLAAAIGIAVVLSRLVEVGFTISRAVLFGGCLGVACQLGDLSESYIKRAMGRRHSGSLLGPEGGLLDFLDAAAFAIVIACLLLSLWGYLH